jgi:transketolase
MRALPGMLVMAPADAMEVRGCLRAALGQDDAPAYLRIGKKGEPVLHAEVPAIAPGRPLRMREGGRGCLLACGNVLPLALDCAEDLSAGSGGPPEVFSVPVVKPLPTDFLAEAFAGHDWVATIEEHGGIGGFGSAVAEWLVDLERRPRAELVRFAADDRFLHETHNQASARQAFGLERGAVARKLRERFGGR